MEYEPLQFDYETLQGQRLSSISGHEPLLCSDGSTVYDSVILAFDHDLLMVSVDDDTDQIVLRTKKLAQVEQTNEHKNIEILRELSGHQLGWCWSGRNWLGYQDTLMFSFDGIDPQLLLYCVASKLSLFRTNKL